MAIDNPLIEELARDLFILTGSASAGDWKDCLETVNRVKETLLKLVSEPNDEGFES